MHAEAVQFAWSIKWSIHSRTRIHEEQKRPMARDSDAMATGLGRSHPLFLAIPLENQGDAARERRMNRDRTMNNEGMFSGAWFQQHRDDPWNCSSGCILSTRQPEILSETSSISSSNRVWLIHRVKGIFVLGCFYEKKSLEDIKHWIQWRDMFLKYVKKLIICEWRWSVEVSSNTGVSF